MKTYTYPVFLDVTNDGYELSFCSFLQIEPVRGKELDSLMLIAKDILTRTISAYKTEGRELPKPHLEAGDATITVSSDDVRKVHQETFRIDWIRDRVYRHAYFEDYSEAIQFAKRKTNSNIVFLLEHTVDGWYAVKQEVKADEQGK